MTKQVEIYKNKFEKMNEACEKLRTNMEQLKKKN